MRFYPTRKRWFSLSGEIATIRIVISETKSPPFSGKIASTPASEEYTIFEDLTRSRLSILEELDSFTRDKSGKEFRCTDVIIQRGSIEVIAIIASVSVATLSTISQYKDLCDSLEQIKNQLISIISRKQTYLADPGPIKSNIFLTQKLKRAGRKLDNHDVDECNICVILYLFSFYLVFSNILLFATIILFLSVDY